MKTTISREYLANEIFRRFSKNISVNTNDNRRVILTALKQNLLDDFVKQYGYTSASFFKEFHGVDAPAEYIIELSYETRCYITSYFLKMEEFSESFEMYLYCRTKKKGGN